jgi:Flp pilus assembly protein TadG
MSLSRTRTRLCRRRGAATVWLLAAAPAILVLLIAVTDLGHLWLATVELETAMEAGALAGAEVWSTGSPTTDVRNAAVAFTGANAVNGMTVVITPNGTPPGPGNPNGNLSCEGNVILGAARFVQVNGPAYNFDAESPPNINFNTGGGPGQRAVRVQATIEIPSLWESICGMPLGPYRISAVADAHAIDFDGHAELIRVVSFRCID